MKTTYIIKKKLLDESRGRHTEKYQKQDATGLSQGLPLRGFTLQIEWTQTFP